MSYRILRRFYGPFRKGPQSRAYEYNSPITFWIMKGYNKIYARKLSLLRTESPTDKPISQL